jgi:hypothetical protein
MPQLTKTRLAQVTDVLDDSFFTSAGYCVVSSDDADVIVRVTLRDHEKYYAELRYETKQRNPFAGIQAIFDDTAQRIMVIYQSPGDFVETERSHIGNFNDFLGALKDWTQRTKSEMLLVNAFQKRLDEFEAELNGRLDAHIKDGSAHFTEEERQELYRKLQEFQERLSELEQSDAATKTEVEKIRCVVDDLGRATHNMTKRAWFRTACSKLYAMSVRALSSKPGQKLLEGAVDKLLENHNRT